MRKNLGAGLIRSLKNITTVVVITLLAMFLFSVVGVSLFKGAFERCSYNDGMNADGTAYIALRNCTKDFVPWTCPTFAEPSQSEFKYLDGGLRVQKPTTSSTNWSMVFVGEQLTEGKHSHTFTWTEAAGLPCAANASSANSSSAQGSTAVYTPNCLAHMQGGGVGFGVYINGSSDGADEFWGANRLNSTHMGTELGGDKYPGVVFSAGDRVTVLVDMDNKVMKYHINDEPNFQVCDPTGCTAPLSPHTPKAVTYHEQSQHCRFMIGHSLGRMGSSYFLTTFPFM